MLCNCLRVFAALVHCCVSISVSNLDNISSIFWLVPIGVLMKVRAVNSRTTVPSIRTILA